MLLNVYGKMGVELSFTVSKYLYKRSFTWTNIEFFGSKNNYALKFFFSVSLMFT